jgi:O-methyltransferase
LDVGTRKLSRQFRKNILNDVAVEEEFRITSAWYIMRQVLRALLALSNEILRRFGFQLSRLQPPRYDLFWADAQDPDLKYSKIVPSAFYAPWLSDAEFMRIYEAVRGHTLVDIYRCFELWDLARQARKLPGCLVEIGVWRGGTGCLLAKAAEGSGKTVFLADTFEGVVKAGPKDTWYGGGEHADTTQATVEDLIRTLTISNVKILKGVFPEQTGESIVGEVALVHVDVDVYNSARDIIAWALPRLSRGGMIVFDDYGSDRCAGVARLVNELRLSLDYLFIYNLNGHAILAKG